LNIILFADVEEGLVGMWAGHLEGDLLHFCMRCLRREEERMC
jgi:hypothetical protein